ncbi:hypothetical protein P43SY_003375 [Pythium insidiosum]|uniref:Uncharacterized protein n=1 Tax=Pythium insidiosum TaxID=114742 RepID=A0AAD5Q1P6_PYTIN|nr:hypothetical protein P43SY_003375 [Pythium insidiosum]
MQLPVKPAGPDDGAAPRRLSRPSLVATSTASRAQRIEELGLFLRHALGDVHARLPTEQFDAIEAMADRGDEPPGHIVDALRTVPGDEATARPLSQLLLAVCSPEELCVCLDTLKQLSEPVAPRLRPIQGDAVEAAVDATSDVAPPSPWCALHGQLHNALRDTVAAATDSDLALVFHGHAAALRPAVLARLAAKRHNQRVAQLLLSALHTACTLSSMSIATRDALHDMLKRGHPLPSTVLHGLDVDQRTPDKLSADDQEALARGVAELSTAELRELSRALSASATASLHPDVLVLWAVLHVIVAKSGRSLEDAVDTRTAEQEQELLEQQREMMEERVDAKEIDVDVTSDLTKQQQANGTQLTADEARAMGRALQRALASGALASAALSQDLRDGLARLADDGVALSAGAARELLALWDRVLLALPTNELRELGNAMARDVSRLVVDTDVAQTLVAQTERVVGRVVDTQDALETAARQHALAVKRRAESIYRSGFATALHAQHEALAARLKESRQRIDEAFTATAGSMAPLLSLRSLCGSERLGAWVHAALHRLSGLVPPLLSVEIVRDFVQTIGLVFTNLYIVVLQQAQHVDGLELALERIQVAYRGIYNLAAIDFPSLYVRADRYALVDIGLAALLALIGCAYVLYLVFAVLAFRYQHVDPVAVSTAAVNDRQQRKKSKSLRHLKLKPKPDDGEDNGDDDESPEAMLAEAKRRIRQRQRQIKLVTYVLTVLLSIYLPVTRLAIDVLAGSRDVSFVRRRYESRAIWPWLQGIAWALLVTFSVPLPLLLARLVYKYKPQTLPPAHPGAPLVTYNLDGEPVIMDDNVYAQKIAQDPAQLQCPYRSLYAGLEMRWCYYKVYQLVFKVALIVPLILITDAAARGYATVAVYAVIFCVTFYSAPFADPLNDVMEISGKLTALVTCVGGLVLAYFDDDAASRADETARAAVGIVVSAANIGNTVLMAGILLFGMQQTRLWVKNALGTLTFSDTVRYLTDLPAAKILPFWDVEREIKHRVWQHFWKALLLSLDDELAIQRLAFSESEMAAPAADRGAAADVSSSQKRRHWAGEANECVAAMRIVTRQVLEGPDAVYDGAFGRLRVVSYPFHCVFTPEQPAGAAEQLIVDDRELALLFFDNFSPAVAAKRSLRRKLRALAQWGGTVELPCEREEVLDNTTPFRCHYTRATVVVDDSFSVRVVYRDGAGEVLNPSTGAVERHVSGYVGEFSAKDALGLTESMEETEPLRAVFAQTTRVLEEFLPRIETVQTRPMPRWHGARPPAAKRQLTGLTSDSVLSAGFRYVVYNNPYISRTALEAYLTQQETNIGLQKVPVTHRAALDTLYTKMTYLQSDPAAKYWYLFWDDSLL